MGKDSDITLTYFDIQGRGEISRLILAYAGVEFEDRRISREDFATKKNELPYGQLPVLEIDGAQLCQSMTIARYLANKFKLAGQTPMVKAQADEVVDALGDLMTKIRPVYLEQDPEQKKKLMEDISPALKLAFEQLEARIDARGGQYMAGESLTWADLLVHVIVNLFVSQGANDLLIGCPKLQALNDKVSNIPRIKEWNENHPNM